jgi:hypothetical protein
MQRTTWTAAVGLLLATAAGACSDGGGAGVGLAFSTRNPNVTLGGAQGASVVQAGDSTVVALGNDTVIIRSVEIVLREIELDRLNDDDCDTIMMGSDDACEEFSTGPVLVSLPLGNGTDKVITVDVPADIYDEVEFEIHKPEDDGSEAAFLAAHPDFAGVSIRVTGIYSQGGTRSDFVYTTDLNKEQEVALVPPLDVTTAGPVNLTIRLDIATWFLATGGAALVDPASANKGGPNEGVVKNNIEQSIEAFHDDDSDGLDDHGEDDDGGSSHDSP